MSIASELNRLLQAKSDLATSIENKGVTVPASATLDDYPALVDQIQQGGEPPLPQGAVEVEYLSTDGAAYIDTGINGKSYFTAVITVSRFEDTTADLLAILGFYESGSTTGLMQVLTKSNKIDPASGRNSFVLGGITTSTTWALNTYYDITITRQVNTTSSKTIFLFCRNTGSANLFNTHIRIKKVTFIRNNKIIQELIPIRIGTVGCMYDKATKTIFSNANSTGAFIIGPDVT